MFTICLMGRYVEFPVQIIIDPTVQESVLSTQFACNHNVPRTVLTVRGVAHVSASGPVVVPTGGGVVSFVIAFQDILFDTLQCGARHRLVGCLPTSIPSRRHPSSI